MGSLTNAYEDIVMEHITDAGDGGGETPPVADCWVGLIMGTVAEDGTDDGDGECDYTTYARQQISFGAASATTDRTIIQSGVLTFPEAGDSATSAVVDWAIYTLESGGAMMAYGTLASEKTIVSGNTPSIATTEIEVAISAGGWHNTLCDLVLDWLFNQGTFNQPANLYVALCKEEIGDSDVMGAGTELTMTGYAREAIPKGSSYWAAISGGATSNAALVDFGTLSSTGETVTAIAICAGSVKDADDCWMWSNAASQAIGDGDDVTFPIGDINLSVA